MDLHSKSQLVALLRQRGIRPSRRLGQSFLIDQNLLRYVAAQAELHPRDLVLEVGAGTGLLTQHLCDSGAAVCAIEIDERLAQVCRDYLGPHDNLTLFNSDVLKSKHQLNPELLDWLRGRLGQPAHSALKVVSNLPYAVSTPVIVGLFESDLPISLMILTLQKEVADRLAATPGDEAYGALSVVVAAHAHVKMLRTLPPDVFWPSPKVRSAIVRLAPTSERLAQIEDYELFRAVVRAAFAHRRKTLLNSFVAHVRSRLSTDAARRLIEDSGLNPGCRGERLGVRQIIALANRMAVRQ